VLLVFRCSNLGFYLVVDVVDMCVAYCCCVIVYAFCLFVLCQVVGDGLYCCLMPTMHLFFVYGPPFINCL